MDLSAYPSFSALIGIPSAADIFPGEQNFVKPGITHRDKPNTSSSYLWKIDAALLLIKRRVGISSPIFQGPQDTTWRLHVNWGDRRVPYHERYMKLTLTFVGSIQISSKFQAGYEIFRGEDEYRRGKIDLDGCCYSLTPSGTSSSTTSASSGEDAGSNQVEWIHHRDLDSALKNSIGHDGSMFIGVKLSFIINEQCFDCRPCVLSLKHDIPEVSGPRDLVIVGRDDQSATAHKSYLAAWSPRLRDLVDHLGEFNTLHLRHYDTQTIRAFLDLIYMGDLNEKEVPGYGVELLRFVQEYDVGFGLQRRICDYLAKNMWREGLLQVFLIANSRPNSEEYVRLRDDAVRLIRQNMPATFEQAVNSGFPLEQIEPVRERIINLSMSLPAAASNLSIWTMGSFVNLL
ncbi:hypothetical protein RvY_00599 [Ramazzottius varieornatus]|uniref:BTB domain-containing protein n=1 Tax=Ramazzottius varieornatus TaxID=947166 RepID=A0A1D1UE94_RAMVA|nr:hypothetical protein RvY_00599 [Ramazzottius varieornatus]